ncbi:MAG TPA: sigma-70 family RNA polymerase sigma factor [Desulfurivibrio alkaliphilus]|uniref:Sigma-70 family RNA polymerase sigma factor n=1 Tax=Desulfurivibrio alkaliphilus TaxID=427923 RepID=A0A7C2TJW2_9BACT|nr:sigma-70 family RNA polymerase sigma factor [Desulfurivibrio alkaliphilus]
MSEDLNKNYQASFERLLRPQIEPLYRLAWRLCANRDDAEDLVQDLLVKLYPRLEKLAEVEELRPWLARSLRNLYADRLRRLGRRPVQDWDVELEEVSDPRSSVPMEPEAALARRQLQGRVTQALALLNEDQRQLIGFHDMEGYTLPELELILGTPLGTLKSRLHRARARLKELLVDGTI